MLENPVNNSPLDTWFVCGEAGMEFMAPAEGDWSGELATIGEFTAGEFKTGESVSITSALFVSFVSI